ncbi:hypothetical protein FQR65_LT09591 [Abscondita terminalis]|nr:hypothetical protein FQR65_LT09591 [Abscondita terminalis]
MDVEKVRNNYRICDYHFAPEYMVSGLVTGAIPTLNSSSYVELDNNALIVQDEPVNLIMESISSPRPQFDFEVVAVPSYKQKHPDLLDKLTPNVGTLRELPEITKLPRFAASAYDLNQEVKAYFTDYVLFNPLTVNTFVELHLEGH